MGRWFRQLGGGLLVAVGLFVALWPFVSVWRISGEVLDELPPIEGTSVDDRRGLSALWDDDFTLATRTYADISVDQVRRRLAGFESTSLGTETYLAKACCGAWDAVLVSLDDGDDPGSTVATVTVADGDLQAVYPFIVSFGVAMTMVGVAALGWRSAGAEAAAPAEPSQV